MEDCGKRSYYSIDIDLSVVNTEVWQSVVLLVSIGTLPNGDQRYCEEEPRWPLHSCQH